jgi:hypothetical protein
MIEYIVFCFNCLNYLTVDVCENLLINKNDNFASFNAVSDEIEEVVEKTTEKIVMLNIGIRTRIQIRNK